MIYSKQNIKKQVVYQTCSVKPVDNIFGFIALKETSLGFISVSVLRKTLGPWFLESLNTLIACYTGNSVSSCRFSTYYSVSKKSCRKEKYDLTPNYLTLDFFVWQFFGNTSNVLWKFQRVCFWEFCKRSIDYFRDE